MKKFFFILTFVSLCIVAYSQTNNDTDITKSLKTIKEVIEDSREGVEFIDNTELIKRININPQAHFT